MPDYGNPKTPLTAKAYAWTATATGPIENGVYPSQVIDGSCVPVPGATVAWFLDGVRATFAKEWGRPVTDVRIASYSIWEK
ncbi:hypothetical protein [Streptomyces sp. DW26H14]|uniref:hypothetical protein n=1 Tax=Streptomyces sp. DW26H14 TaxID=3435395 RepID=UPI00403D63FC